MKPLFPHCLQKAMADAGMSAAEVCDAIDMKAQQFSRYIARGERPSGQIVERICAAFPDDVGDALWIAWISEQLTGKRAARIHVEKKNSSSTGLFAAIQRLPDEAREVLSAIVPKSKDEDVLGALRYVGRLAAKLTT